MAKDEKTALISRPGTEVSTGEIRQTSPVISRMTRDMLARAQSQALSAARFRIGDYELRETDYRQILDWADDLDLEPEAILECISGSRKESTDREDWTPISFEVVDGAIRSLVWDLDELGLIPSEWLDGLAIEKLALVGDWPVSTIVLAPKLTLLDALICDFIALNKVNLFPVRGLTLLDCGINQLTELDLSPVPGLTVLRCHFNQLTALDLSPVPVLKVLRCGVNQFTELDLSPVPGLTELWCGVNRLTELDLSPATGLTELSCEGNQLTVLDLSPVPGLRELECRCNQLTVLDLSPVPGLTELRCGGNQLTELDLSPVPGLTNLYCDHNQLTELDLSPVPGLTELVCDRNQLTVLDLSPVPGLTELVCDEDIRIFNAPRGLECDGTIVSYADPDFDDDIT